MDSFPDIKEPAGSIMTKLLNPEIVPSAKSMTGKICQIISPSHFASSQHDLFMRVELSKEDILDGSDALYRRGGH